MTAYLAGKGEYDYTTGGEYKSGEKIEKKFTGAVTALTQQDIKYAENGTYKTEDRKLYCYENLPLGTEIKHKGLLYKVAERKDYSDFAGGLFLYFLKRQGGLDE